MVALLIKFLWDKALYGRVTRPLLDFSERGLGTRLEVHTGIILLVSRSYIRECGSLRLCPVICLAAQTFLWSAYHDAVGVLFCGKLFCCFLHNRVSLQSTRVPLQSNKSGPEWGRGRGRTLVDILIGCGMC